jgi:hypothetical protein
MFVILWGGGGILDGLIALFDLEYFIKNSDGVIAPFLLRIFHQEAY